MSSGWWKCQNETKLCFEFCLWVFIQVSFPDRPKRKRPDISILHITNKYCLCKALQSLLVSMTTGMFCSLIFLMLLSHIHTVCDWRSLCYLKLLSEYFVMLLFSKVSTWGFIWDRRQALWNSVYLNYKKLDLYLQMINDLFYSFNAHSFLTCTCHHPHFQI